jgi:hypothetical protein
MDYKTLIMVNNLFNSLGEIKQIKITFGNLTIPQLVSIFQYTDDFSVEFDEFTHRAISLCRYN